MAPKVRWDCSRKHTRVEIPTPCGNGKVVVEVSSDGCVKNKKIGGGKGSDGRRDIRCDDKSTTKYNWAYSNSEYYNSGLSSSDGGCKCDCSHECEQCESDDGGEGWSGNDDSENELAERFAVHGGVSCYYCNQGEIRGIRWVYSHNTHYSACSKCVPDEYNWKGIEYPWKNKVPRAPLNEKMSYWSDRVAHLQKVLTDMGYMSLRDTDVATGYFQTRTADAVEKFRRDYGLMSCNMRVYDGRTEKKLEEALSYYAC